MSLAVLRSRALAGMAAPAVNVEVHLANGLPAFTIDGNNLPVPTLYDFNIHLKHRADKTLSFGAD